MGKACPAGGERKTKGPGVSAGAPLTLKRTGGRSYEPAPAPPPAPAPAVAVSTSVLMVVKAVSRLVPTSCSAPTRTTAIRAAIRPYSMAVAPDSFFRKREMNFDMKILLNSNRRQDRKAAGLLAPKC